MEWTALLFIFAFIFGITYWEAKYKTLEKLRVDREKEFLETIDLILNNPQKGEELRRKFIESLEKSLKEIKK